MALTGRRCPACSPHAQFASRPSPDLMATLFYKSKIRFRTGYCIKLSFSLVSLTWLLLSALLPGACLPRRRRLVLPGFGGFCTLSPSVHVFSGWISLVARRQDCERPPRGHGQPRLVLSLFSIWPYSCAHLFIPSPLAGHSPSPVCTRIECGSAGLRACPRDMCPPLVWSHGQEWNWLVLCPHTQLRWVLLCGFPKWFYQLILLLPSRQGRFGFLHLRHTEQCQSFSFETPA